MSTFILINNVLLGTQKMLPGTHVDDAVTDTAPIIAAGGELVSTSDATVLAASAVALNAHLNRGMNEIDMEAIMRASVDASQAAALSTNAGTVSANSAQLAKLPAIIQAGTLAVLIAGTKTLAAGITISASSKIFLQVVTPGGTMGTHYKLTGVTTGAPGVGAFTVTAVDTSGSLVNTDTSTLNYTIVG